MSMPLEVTLIVVLGALTLGVLPLLVQLRRTARSLDAFLVEGRRDLRQIAEDVHAVRLRTEALAASLEAPVEELTTFARALGDAGRTVRDLQARVQGAAESLSRRFAALTGGLSAVLGLLGARPLSSHSPEEVRP